MYEGDWQDDKRCGRGTLNKANGDVFEGSWLNDKKHGDGVYTYRVKKKRYVGTWMEDTPKAGEYSALGEVDSSLPTLEAVIAAVN